MVTSSFTNEAQGSLDQMINDLKADGDALKAEINSTNLYKTGLIEGLVNKVYIMRDKF